jgi:lipopolysaccharide/colanic/teichoic acid biosynthesis glycosyltransferase
MMPDIDELQAARNTSADGALAGKRSAGSTPSQDTLHVERPQYQGAKSFQKRAFHFCFALAALIGMSPLLVASAVAIKLSSMGPVFSPSELQVKPGVLGLWQVNGHSDLAWDESVRSELSNVDNWSMASDFLLITKALKAVLLTTEHIE